MGIGQKIKNALDPEHERGTQSTQGEVPGAYPDETTRHNPQDTRDYVHTAGTAGEPRSAGMPGAKIAGNDTYNLGGDRVARRGLQGEPGLETGTTGSRDPRAAPGVGGATGAGVVAHEYGREKGSHGHKQHDSGVDLARGGRQNDPYWGDMESGRRGAGAGGFGEAELAERPRHGHGHHGAARNDLQATGDAAGGGVYNTVTGAGSNEDTTTRRQHPVDAKPAAISSSAMSSGAIGSTAADPSLGARRNLYDEKTQVYGAPSSRDDSGGRGLAGASAGAAGIAAATEETHHHNKQTGRHHNPAPAPGEPRSSMLDPYSTGDSTGAGTAPGSSMLDPYSTGPDTTRRQHEPSSLSGGATQFDTRKEPMGRGLGQGSDQVAGDYIPGAGINSGRGANPNSGSITGEETRGLSAGPTAGPGLGSGNNTGAGIGKDYYGPAHEGAKVMHRCHQCGADNDISRYFKGDAVYRIGS